ncbi:MAG: hypothetical protein RRY34_07570 [Victivallaceae bacterium]
MKKALLFAPFAFCLLVWKKYKYKFYVFPHHPKVFVDGEMIAYRAHSGVWFVKAGYRWMFSRRSLERLHSKANPIQPKAAPAGTNELEQ